MCRWQTACLDRCSSLLKSDFFFCRVRVSAVSQPMFCARAVVGVKGPARVDGKGTWPAGGGGARRGCGCERERGCATGCPLYKSPIPRN